ncbi:rhodanese-like domain-containing protein [Flavihumibacter stibioxidans]|uniref:Sulfurtransferase n=1 Tax=Flavihumibacter stibioxidans TaxID=1834163 RepID=A0ABR7M9J8_9BACT|nr:rhodanese-like domain-containing protein [Flavihumibacter stibioxidans]MBC6491301.1 sulfurtransferase [Flavihumibacter stibioxidans]
MKYIFIAIIFSLSSSFAYSQELSLEKYLTDYTYESRKEMKIGSEQLVALLKKGEAILIDVRFLEEYKSWNMPVAKHIPLPELPQRLTEIDKTKIIVTACPHKDRAIIGMLYLKTRGFSVKYLDDGLTGLAEYLRGDKAKFFINK